MTAEHIDPTMADLLIAAPSRKDVLRLTLDPSPTSTGWMRGKNHKVQAGGTRRWFHECGVRADTDWIGKVDLAYGRFLHNQLTSYPIAEMVIEMPATPAPDRYNIWHSGFVTHQFFKAIALAEIAGVPWRPVPTSSLKMWALGKGYGHAEAKQLIPWCQAAGYDVKGPDHAVAVTILEWARAHPR